LTFRYACPNSSHARLKEQDGVNNDARIFFSQYRDRRLIIDPEHRKEESNKGPTRKQQRANAAAAAALGQDPRAPGNVVIARQPLPTPAPNGAPTFTEQWMARIGYGLEQYLAQTGVDFTNAPPAPSFASQGGAPSTTPSAPSATTVNPTTREEILRGDERGGDGDGDADESDPPPMSDDGDGEEDAPQSPPSPAAVVAIERRATRATMRPPSPRERSARARKAPRRL